MNSDAIGSLMPALFEHGSATLAQGGFAAHRSIVRFGVGRPLVAVDCPPMRDQRLEDVFIGTDVGPAADDL